MSTDKSEIGIIAEKLRSTHVIDNHTHSHVWALTWLQGQAIRMAEIIAEQAAEIERLHCQDFGSFAIQ